MLSDAVASIAEVAPDLDRVGNRWDQLSFDRPKVFYTDNCCADRAIVKKALDGRGVDRNSQQKSETSQPCLLSLILPQPSAHIKTSAVDFVTQACIALEVSSQTSENKEYCQGAAVLGVQLEWDLTTFGDPTLKELCISTVSGLSFSFEAGEDTKSLPRALLQLLGNTDVLKVGLGLEHDARYLMEVYDAYFGPLQSVDSVVVRLLGSKKAGNCSLQELSANVLQRLLPVSSSSESAACVQSFAAVLIFAYATASADPVYRRAPQKDEIQQNAKIRLYDISNSQHIASGLIVQYDKETWGSTGIRLVPAHPGTRQASATEQRVVVKISSVLVPGALLLYSDERGEKLTVGQAGEGTLILWDLVSVCKPGNLLFIRTFLPAGTCLA